MRMLGLVIAVALLASSPFDLVGGRLAGEAWATRPCPAMVIVNMAADGAMSVDGLPGRARVPVTDATLLEVVGEQVRLARRSDCYRGKIVVLYDPAVRLTTVTALLDRLQEGGFFDVSMLDATSIPPPPPYPS